MHRIVCWLLLCAVAFVADQAFANQKFYVEKVSVEGLGGYDLPCENYSARLQVYADLTRMRFEYISTCDGVERSTDGYVTFQTNSNDGGKCWDFFPNRFGVTGCGSYDHGAGTLTFSRQTASGEITVRWRECRGSFAGQSPCR